MTLYLWVPAADSSWIYIGFNCEHCRGAEPGGPDWDFEVTTDASFTSPPGERSIMRLAVEQKLFAQRLILFLSFLQLNSKLHRQPGRPLSQSGRLLFRVSS